MRFSQIRNVLVGLSLLTFAGTVPTLAKQPIKPGSAQLIAQVPAATSDSLTISPDSSIVDSTVIDASSSNAQILIKNFFATAASGATVTVPLPVESFLYIYGGVGDAGDITDLQTFRSYFKTLEATNKNDDDYGVIGASGDGVAAGPFTAKAISGFSPSLSSSDISKIKSVKLQFNYAFVDPLGKDTLKVTIQKVGGGSTFSSNLVATAGSPASIDITKAFTTAGQYETIYSLVKPGSTTNDAVGFVNVNLIITLK